VLGVGCWVLGVGCWVLGVARWVLGVGRWALGVGRRVRRLRRLRRGWVGPASSGSRFQARVPWSDLRPIRSRSAETLLLRTSQPAAAIPAIGDWFFCAPGREERRLAPSRHAVAGGARRIPAYPGDKRRIAAFPGRLEPLCDGKRRQVPSSRFQVPGSRFRSFEDAHLGRADGWRAFSLVHEHRRVTQTRVSYSSTREAEGPAGEVWQAAKIEREGARPSPPAAAVELRAAEDAAARSLRNRQAHSAGWRITEDGPSGNSGAAGYSLVDSTAPRRTVGN